MRESSTGEKLSHWKANQLKTNRGAAICTHTLDVWVTFRMYRRIIRMCMGTYKRSSTSIERKCAQFAIVWQWLSNPVGITENFSLLACETFVYVYMSHLVCTVVRCVIFFGDEFLHDATLNKFISHINKKRETWNMIQPVSNWQRLCHSNQFIQFEIFILILFFFSVILCKSIQLTDLLEMLSIQW